MTNSRIIVGRGQPEYRAVGLVRRCSGWGGFHDLINTEQQSWAFVNYRGYGDRKDLDGPYTNAQIAADVLEVADRLEWDDFALVGHSLGGKAIQRVYADARQRVTALIGISPIHASAFPLTTRDGSSSRKPPTPRRTVQDHRLHHRQPEQPNLDQQDGRLFDVLLNPEAFGAT